MLQTTVDIGSHLDIGNFFKITDVGSLISGILAAALLFAGIAFMLYFLWGAFRWLTAGSDKAQMEAARQKITNAFIGLTLVAAAWAIYLIVIYVLGLEAAIEIGGSGGNGENGEGTGNPACVCWQGLGCAQTGQVAIGTDGCYRCTASGWYGPIGGTCEVIECVPCS